MPLGKSLGVVRDPSFRQCPEAPPGRSSAPRRSAAIFFSFNHFQIFLDKYGTNLVTLVVILSPYTRRSTRLRSPVIISSHATFKPSPAKPCRIRTSENPRLQPLWNPHMQKRFLSADSKRIIFAEWRLQSFYNQHLRGYPVSAENAGLITPLKSALTKNLPATPLESALPKNRGRGPQPCSSLLNYSDTTFQMGDPPGVFPIPPGGQGARNEQCSNHASA